MTTNPLTESETLTVCSIMTNLCDQERLSELLSNDDEAKVNETFDRLGSELLKHNQTTLKKTLAEVTAKLLRATFIDVWQCECGSDESEVVVLYCDDREQESYRQCLLCGERYCADDVDVPTRLEGSK